MKSARAAAVAVLLATTPTLALAQSDDDDTKTDVVHLKDGTTVRGLILKRVEGQSLLIRRAGGTRQTLEWSSIASIEGEGASTDPAAGSGSSQSPGAAASPARPATPAGPVPDEPAGHTSWAGVIEGAMMLGGVKQDKPTSIFFLGVGLTGGVRFRAGMKFPRPNGGNWHGFGAQGAVGLYGALASYERYDRPSVFNQDSTGPLLVLDAGVTPGYQFYHFSAVDQSDHSQIGVGLFVGCRLGAAYTRTIGSDLGDFKQGAFQWGPQLTLTVPRRDLQTKKRRGISFSMSFYEVRDYFVGQLSLGGEL